MIALLFLLAQATPAEEGVITAGMAHLGTPYGPSAEKGLLDCSGLVTIAIRDTGLTIRRITTRRAFLEWERLPEPRRGGIPMFTHNGKTPAHMGVWLDAGIRMIHASSSKGVIISSVNKYYWLPRYMVTLKMPLEIW